MFIIDPIEGSLYEVLGVSPIASFKEINTAAKKCLKDYQNALRKAKGAEKEKIEEEQKKFREAWDKLKKEEERKKYDEQNPIGTLFSIQQITPSFFKNCADRLGVVSKAFRSLLLTEKMDGTFIELSDLFRNNFENDFTPYSYIDDYIDPKSN